MLNAEAVDRLNSLIEVIGTEQLDAGQWEVTEFRWLAKKLKEVNEELKLQSDNSDHCLDHCICLVCMK